MSMHQTFHQICKAWMVLNRSWQVPRLTFTAHEKLLQLPPSDMETIDCLQLCMTFSDKGGKDEIFCCNSVMKYAPDEVGLQNARVAHTHLFQLSLWRRCAGNYFKVQINCSCLGDSRAEKLLITIKSIINLKSISQTTLCSYGWAAPGSSPGKAVQGFCRLPGNVQPPHQPWLTAPPSSGKALRPGRRLTHLGANLGSEMLNGVTQ